MQGCSSKSGTDCQWLWPNCRGENWLTVCDRLCRHNPEKLPVKQNTATNKILALLYPRVAIQKQAIKTTNLATSKKKKQQKKTP